MVVTGVLTLCQRYIKMNIKRNAWHVHIQFVKKRMALYNGAYLSIMCSFLLPDVFNKQRSVSFSKPSVTNLSFVS